MADEQGVATSRDQAPPGRPRFFRNPESLFLLGGKILVPPIGVALAAAMFGFDIAWLCALLALLTFSIAGPVHILQCRSFWLGALVAAATWFGMFIILAAVADAVGWHKTGEGAMLLLLPMMVFPCVLGLVGVVRFFQLLAASSSEPAPSPPDPPPAEER